MNGAFIAVFAVVSLILGVGCWLGWQLLRQNGRILVRLDELEKQLHELEFGELALADLRGKRVLLVFSDPHCGPCAVVAPELQKFHREHPEIVALMISRGEPKENRAKAKEHGLTFPIVLQQRWEISRRYAMFATPIAYLIDESGTITHEVAVGVDAIQALMTRAVYPRLAVPV